MPIIRRLLIPVVLILLVGCGSQTPRQQDRSDVADLARILHQYNVARVHDLAQQAAVCTTAGTQAKHIPPLDSHISGKPGRQATVINVARADAIAGFRDCAEAATALDYPLMVRAQAKLAAANSHLARAKT